MSREKWTFSRNGGERRVERREKESEEERSEQGCQVRYIENGGRREAQHGGEKRKRERRRKRERERRDCNNKRSKRGRGIN